MSQILITTSEASTHSMDKAQYYILKESLLVCTKAAVLISFADLVIAVGADLKKRKHLIFGKMGWHLAWVALHLESQHLLSKVASGNKQIYSLPLIA